MSETFNNHYVNIIEKTTGSKPDTGLHKFCDMNTHSAISKIKDTYANHPRRLRKMKQPFLLKKLPKKKS